MLCRITQSSDAHRTESVSVMDHEQMTYNVFGGMLNLAQSINRPIHTTTMTINYHHHHHTAIYSDVYQTGATRKTQKRTLNKPIQEMPPK